MQSNPPDLGSLIRNKLRVALDVDGTLAYSYEQIVAQWNDINYTHYTVNDARANDFLSIMGMTQWDFKDQYELAWRINWRKIGAAVGEMELKRLVERFEVDLVTNRPRETLEGLTSWLELKFPDIKFNVVLASPREKFGGGYDIYIEDGDSLADIFVENSGKTEKRLFLVDAFCNRHRDYENHEGIKRVDSLGAAIGLLLKEAQTQNGQVRAKQKQ
jgi:5'(3')-deoxyribonucleotidase